MSLERVNLTKKNLFELKNISFQLKKKKKKKNLQKSTPKIMNTGVDQLPAEWISRTSDAFVYSS